MEFTEKIQKQIYPEFVVKLWISVFLVRQSSTETELHQAVNTTFC